MENIKMAFFLSTLAGLSTMLGTIIIFVNKKRTNGFIAGALAFASSVMFCLSLFDLIPEAIHFFSKTNATSSSFVLCFIFVIVGIFISYLLDYFVPEDNNFSNMNDKKLYKVGIITMLAIIIHNIPEGIATFITTADNITLGLTLTIAITLHNIPEGISIALPIYYSLRSKKKALLYTFISAVSEPLGALIAFLFIRPSSTTFGILFSIIAGIMTYIAIFELLPNSFSYQKRKTTFFFLLLGAIIVFINIFVL